MTHSATEAVAAAPLVVPRPDDLGIGLLFWHMRDAVVVGEAASGRVVLWNPAAEALFGYPAAEAVGLPLEALVPERLRPAHRAGLAAFAATGCGRLLEAGEPVEVPALRRGGAEIAVELSLTPIVQTRVPGRYVAAVLRDATARRRAAELHARLAAIVESSDDPIVGKALDGTITSWNPAAERLYGYAAAEAVGRPSAILVPPGRPDEVPAMLARVAAGERVDDDETEHVAKDGRRVHVSLTVAPVRGADGRVVGASAIARDATERKRIERERAALLAAAEEHARRLEQLATLKADFAAMVAHELGGPVAAIRAWADLLAADDLDPGIQARARATVRAEADLLWRLVADVRQAAAAERDDFAVRPRPVPVGALLGDAAAVARVLPGDHPLAVEIGVDPGARVLADPERIGQVLRNLLGNAGKHTPPGTPIALQALPAGDRVRIEVADRGPGIHPDDLARIFEKFGRGRDALGARVPGVGLGLYLSRRLVAAHGAELTVASTPGEGTVFGFALEVAP